MTDSTSHLSNNYPRKSKFLACSSSFAVQIREEQREAGTHTMTGESKRRTTITMSSPLRPPAQVYTRGTMGAVKTRPVAEVYQRSRSTPEQQRDAYSCSHDGSVSTNSRTSRRANRSRDGSPDSTKLHGRMAKKVIDGAFFIRHCVPLIALVEQVSFWFAISPALCPKQT